MSASPDSTLANPDQRIADLERQLAEREAELAEAQRNLNETMTERDEALAREAATAEVLQVINSSPGDLAPVFDAMLDKAMRLCEASFGVMHKYDRGSFYPLALRGVPAAYSELLLREPLKFGPDTALGRIEAGEDVISSTDAAVDYRQTSSLIKTLQKLGGIRSVVFVSLRKDGALLGVLIAYRQEARAFSEKQIALLKNFAAQAVIAMENARLITETREALEQQTATAEVLQVINSSPGDLAPVFDAILEKAHTLCGAALGSFCLNDGERMPAVATRGFPEEHAAVAREGLPTNGPFGKRLARGEITHIPDVTATADPVWLRQSPDQTANAIGRAAVEITGSRTYLAVPLRKDGALLGYLSAHRQEVRPFTDKQIGLLQNFAAQAIIAMENARLITETREALEQQTATAEVLGVINSSPGDLKPVFEAILDKAHSLCGAALGGLLIYDGEEFRPIAIHAEPSFAEYWRQTPVRPPTEGDAPLAQLMRGAQLVHLPDVRTSDAYRDHPGYRDLANRGGLRTLLTVALRSDRGVLGAISAYRQEVRPFTDKQVTLLQSFAAQAVIAMENARLLGELRQRTDQVAELNRGLEARVAAQVEELGRVGRLKRFLAPQLAELIVSQGDENILESHRREIVVVFCDLRGYTAFTETAEPEEVLDFLREYHGALGPLVSQFEGTLDQFSGDGIMVFFNDPVPCPDPAERAVKMAMAMREEAGKLIATWRRDGCELGFGTGIAQGYATLGQIGFSERSGYTAIGTVCNLAARLCAEAKDAQILISSRVARAVEAVATLEDLGNLELRGLRRPVAAFNVVQSTSAADARPNLKGHEERFLPPRLNAGCGLG